MGCKQTRESLELYVLGELGASDRTFIAGHLAACPSCREAAVHATALVRRLDAAVQGGATPRDLPERILETVARHQRRRRLLWAPSAAAACAAAAIAIWLLWASLAGRQVPGEAMQMIACQVQPEGPASFSVVAPRRIRLDSGRILVTAGKAADPLVVQTPAGDATALGTQFHVQCDPMPVGVGKPAVFQTTVVVVSGVVQLANALGSQAAHAGETLDARSDMAPRLQAKPSTIEGTVVRVDGKILVLKVASKGRDGKVTSWDMGVPTDDKTIVSVDGHDARLADVKKNMTALVSYTIPEGGFPAGASPTADRVEVKTNP